MIEGKMTEEGLEAIDYLLEQKYYAISPWERKFLDSLKKYTIVSDKQCLTFNQIWKRECSND